MRPDLLNQIKEAQEKQHNARRIIESQYVPEFEDTFGKDTWHMLSQYLSSIEMNRGIFQIPIGRGIYQLEIDWNKEAGDPSTLWTIKYGIKLKFPYNKESFLLALGELLDI